MVSIACLQQSISAVCEYWQHQNTACLPACIDAAAHQTLDLQFPAAADGHLDRYREAFDVLIEVLQCLDR